MKYLPFFLAIILTFPALAQKPNRRGRAMQEVVIDTSRWQFIRIAPAPRAQLVPLVATLAKPDATTASMAQPDTLTKKNGAVAPVSAPKPDLSPLAALMAKNDSALAASKPLLTPSAAVTLTPANPVVVLPKPGVVSPPVVAPTPAPVVLPKPTAVVAPVVPKPVPAPAVASKPTAVTAAVVPKPVPKPVVSAPKPASVSYMPENQITKTQSDTATTRLNPTRSLTFIERFGDNQNGWLNGSVGQYYYEIAPFYNSYYIRREASKRPSLPAITYVKLPDSLNLSRAESFAVTVEIVVPKGTPVDGGLVVGFQDAKNYLHFMLRGERAVSVKWVANGGSMASYMPGNDIAPGVPINALSNKLTIRKAADKLHFLINERELATSPYDFRAFRANGIGFISAGDAVKFQNLTVVVSPAR